MKNRTSTIILILVFLFGLSLLLYPTVSDYWNSLHQSRAISAYVDQVKSLDQNQYNNLIQSAVDYNTEHAKRGNIFYLDDEEREFYNSKLDISGNGIMGYIEIPEIGCSLPIYHGTQQDILQIAIGHMEGTSLPVGGDSSHCVLSGHRGLPSAVLFSNLDKLVIGDVFTINVLNEIYTYEVYEISTVLPYELESLRIEPYKDLCTLVTCTPYGVNTHRLLVKAQRIENLENAPTTHVVADAMQIEPTIVAPILAIPMLLILLIILIFQPKRKKGENHEN